MKLNVTCLDCDITIEELDGKCVIVATRDGEVVEEFSIDCEGSGEEVDTDEVDNDEERPVDVDADDADDMECMDEMPEEEDEEEEMMEGVMSFTKFSKKKK